MLRFLFLKAATPPLGDFEVIFFDRPMNTKLSGQVIRSPNLDSIMIKMSNFSSNLLIFSFLNFCCSPFIFHTQIFITRFLL